MLPLRSALVSGIFAAFTPFSAAQAAPVHATNVETVLIDAAELPRLVPAPRNLADLATR